MTGQMTAWTGSVVVLPLQGAVGAAGLARSVTGHIADEFCLLIA